MARSARSLLAVGATLRDPRGRAESACHTLCLNRSRLSCAVFDLAAARGLVARESRS